MRFKKNVKCQPIHRKIKYLQVRTSTTSFLVIIYRLCRVSPVNRAIVQSPVQVRTFLHGPICVFRVYFPPCVAKPSLWSYGTNVSLISRTGYVHFIIVVKSGNRRYELMQECARARSIKLGDKSLDSRVLSVHVHVGAIVIIPARNAVEASGN